MSGIVIQDWTYLEPRRARLYRCGIYLVLLGILCEVAAWAWVTGALALATGAVLCDNFSSQERLEGKLAGRLGCCGEKENIKGNDRCCCAPYHIYGLLVAVMVGIESRSS